MTLHQQVVDLVYQSSFGTVFHPHGIMTRFGATEAQSRASLDALVSACQLDRMREVYCPNRHLVYQGLDASLGESIKCRFCNKTYKRALCVELVFYQRYSVNENEEWDDE